MTTLQALLGTLANLLVSRTWGSTGKEVELSSFWIEGAYLLRCPVNRTLTDPT